MSRTGNRKGDLSPKTLRLYSHLLGKLADFLHNPSVDEITAKDLGRFMTSLAATSRGLSPSAQDNYFKAIRSFWKWAVEVLNIPPAAAFLRQPVVIADPVIPFTKADIQRILNACEFTTRTSPGTRKPYTQHRHTETRDKAIIALLLDTGLRIGECARLTQADLFMDHNSLRVTPYYSGKKSRPREIPFGRTSKRWLWQYLSETKPDERKPLFGLTTTGLTRLFARLETRSGVIGVHAHRFRHTFAIEYLRNDGDVFTLQYILGHSDLTMCRRYLAIAKTDVQKAHMHASPVENWNL